MCRVFLLFCSFLFSRVRAPSSFNAFFAVFPVFFPILPRSMSFSSRSALFRRSSLGSAKVSDPCLSSLFHPLLVLLFFFFFFFFSFLLIFSIKSSRMKSYAVCPLVFFSLPCPLEFVLEASTVDTSPFLFTLLFLCACPPPPPPPPPPPASDQTDPALFS